MSATTPGGGPLRVGWLGAGLIATFHSKMLRASGAPARWVAVHDPDTSRAERFAAATGARVVASAEEVIEAADAVYVCTPTTTHAGLVAAVARAGRAVFCEKPLAVDAPAARGMLEEVTRAGVPHQVGLILRRSPAFRHLRRVLSEGTHGRVLSVDFHDDQCLPVGGTYASSWRADPALAGRGTLLEHSIHDLDLLEWVIGAAAGSVTEVSAVTRDVHGLGPIEDVAVCRLRWADGTVGTLTSVWHDIGERPSTRRLEVVCERARIVVDGDWFGPVTIQAAGEGTRVLEGDALLALEPGRNPDGEFVTDVAGGRRPWPSFEVAVRAHELVDAAYRSAAEGGRPVRVPPPGPEGRSGPGDPVGTGP